MMARALTARALIGGCLLAIPALWPDVAAAQGAPSQDQNANTGNDLFRPPANLFQMMYDYKTAPGSGSLPGSTRDVTTETLNLRMAARSPKTRSAHRARPQLTLPLPPPVSRNPTPPAAAPPDGPLHPSDPRAFTSQHTIPCAFVTSTVLPAGFKMLAPHSRLAGSNT